MYVPVQKQKNSEIKPRAISFHVAPRGVYRLSACWQVVVQGSAECSYHRIHRLSASLTFVRSLAPARSTPQKTDKQKSLPNGEDFLFVAPRGVEPLLPG